MLAKNSGDSLIRVLCAGLIACGVFSVGVIVAEQYSSTSAEWHGRIQGVSMLGGATVGYMALPRSLRRQWLVTVLYFPLMLLALFAWGIYLVASLFGESL